MRKRHISMNPLQKPVPDIGFQETGVYIDVKFTPQGDKFKAVYQGITLPEFVPGNTEEIY